MRIYLGVSPTEHSGTYFSVNMHGMTLCLITKNKSLPSAGSYHYQIPRQGPAAPHHSPAGGPSFSQFPLCIRNDPEGIARILQDPQLADSV